MNSFVRAPSENWEHWNGSLLSILPQTPINGAARFRKTRWLVLALSCFLLFGNYYAYDNPASLNTFLQPHLGVSYDEWQLILGSMYAVYSLPNTFLPLFGGSLLDHYDPRFVLLLFSSCVLSGQMLFALGTSARSSTLMLVGRAFFGIGGESCGVAQSWIVARWFRGHEMAFALGLTLCVARLGSVANSVLSPRFAKSYDVTAAVWVGCGTCLFSFCCAIGLCLVITKYKKTLLVNQGAISPNLAAKSEETDSLLSNDQLVSGSRAAVLFEKGEDCDLLEQTFQQSPKRDTQLSLERRIGRRRSHTPSPSGSSEGVSLIPSYTGVINCFPTTFWLLSAICILLYGTVVPFNNIASDFLQSKWYHNDPERAGLVMSIPDTLSAMLVPPIGYLVDRYGKRASMLIVGSATIAAVHFILGLTSIVPVGPFIALGISYSIYGVAIWPSIACVVDHADKTATRQRKLLSSSVTISHLGMAYGLATAFLNTALTVFPFVAAVVRVKFSTTWVPLEMLFASMPTLGFILGIFLYYIDFQNGRVLESPSNSNGDSLDDFSTLETESNSEDLNAFLF